MCYIHENTPANKRIRRGMQRCMYCKLETLECVKTGYECDWVLDDYICFEVDDVDDLICDNPFGLPQDKESYTMYPGFEK